MIEFKNRKKVNSTDQKVENIQTVYMFVGSGSQEPKSMEFGLILETLGACDAINFVNKQVFDDYFSEIYDNMMNELRDRGLFEKYKMYDMNGFESKEDEEDYSGGIEFVGDTVFGEIESEEKKLFYNVIMRSWEKNVNKKDYEIEGYDIPRNFTFLD